MSGEEVLVRCFDYVSKAVFIIEPDLSVRLLEDVIPYVKRHARNLCYIQLFKRTIQSHTWVSIITNR